MNGSCVRYHVISTCLFKLLQSLFLNRPLISAGKHLPLDNSSQSLVSARTRYEHIYYSTVFVCKEVTCFYLNFLRTRDPIAFWTPCAVHCVQAEIVSAEWLAQSARTSASGRATAGGGTAPLQLRSVDWSLNLVLSSSQLQRVKQPLALFAFNLEHADLVRFRCSSLSHYPLIVAWKHRAEFALLYIYIRW